MSTEPHKASDEFIPINQILNSKPQLGPIPGEQVIPWICIALVSYLICQGLLQLDWWATGLVTVWGIATWWILNGNDSSRFLTKFHGTPNWTRGHLPYTSLLTQGQVASKHKQRSTQAKGRRTR